MDIRGVDEVIMHSSLIAIGMEVMGDEGVKCA
jgi:hypothetical protein